MFKPIQGSPPNDGGGSGPGGIAAGGGGGGDLGAGSSIGHMCIVMVQSGWTIVSQT